ncbi:unnamed protein product [Rhodiola kirilowii]
MNITPNNSVDTVNAAATAIVSAESRVQPQIAEKRNWKSYLSLYWCFGSHKNKKRIGHAVLVPEPAAPGVPVPAAETSSHPNPIPIPFIAPPSSPASFLQSEPHSSTQSPGILSSLTSLSANVYSPRGPASIFAIGPYAHETQLVSPPVFSAFTTQPSTAPYTPPPEQVQMTTPSSPDVPYAKMLTSLDPSRRGGANNQKHMLSQYEFQPYQLYPGSPGGHLISPGSVISNSGTSSPLPDRRSIYELRIGEAPKLLGFEYFTTRKWGSRLGSGAVTPDGAGLGSRLGSGSVTPDGAGVGSRLGSGAVTPDVAGTHSRIESGSVTPDGVVIASRLGSGTVTPNGTGLLSRLGSGCLTPDTAEPISTGILGNSLGSPVTLIPASGCDNDVPIVDHRVSFELTGEDVARCMEYERVASLRFVSGATGCVGIDENKLSEEASDGQKKNQTIGPTKEFNFDNTSEKKLGTEVEHNENWSFFPILRPGVS